MRATIPGLQPQTRTFIFQNKPTSLDNVQNLVKITAVMGPTPLTEANSQVTKLVANTGTDTNQSGPAHCGFCK